MTQKTLVLAGVAVAALAFAPQASAQSDVTAPGDLISLVNGFNDGDGNAGAPPANEGVEHAIDNVGQKYLNFLDVASGFTVTPSAGPSIITGIRLWTANDATERDPASVQVEGSNDGSTWTVLLNSAVSLPTGRNGGGNAALEGSNNRQIDFVNTTAYTSYKVIFPTLRNANTANSMQIAEVELLGTVVPEPSTLALLGLAGGLGLALRRRK